MPAQPPGSEQPNKIPVNELKPRMDALIERFKGKLAECHEFKNALANDYLFGKQDLQGVSFQMEEYQYYIYCKGVAELTEEEFEAFSKSGVGPYAGWKTLLIERARQKESSGHQESECINMHISPFESRNDKTVTRYTNNDGVAE